MNWTRKDFGADLKDLNPQVQGKALGIANRLMEEGSYTEEEAITEAVKEPGEWYYNRQA